MSVTLLNPVKSIAQNSGMMNITTTTSYSYTGVSFTIPANTPFMVYARHYYANADPTGIALSELSTSAANHYNVYASGTDVVTLAGVLPAQVTLYVHAKAATAGKQNRIDWGYCYLNA